jgi:hypothetical protein
MDNSINQDIIKINKIYANILKKCKRVYDNSTEQSPDALNSAHMLELYSEHLRNVNVNIALIIDVVDKYTDQCLKKANNIRQYIDLYNKYELSDDTLFKTYGDIYKNVSWADMDEYDNKCIDISKKVDMFISKKYDNSINVKQPKFKTLSSINNVNIGFDFKIPIVDKLGNIPPSLYWFSGGGGNPAGIYTSPHKGFYIQVPLMDVIDPDKSTAYKTIKCARGSKKQCTSIRKKTAHKKKYNYSECKYAHSGETFKKIGSYFRCNKMPHFGNNETLSSDFDIVELRDIKTMLMHSTSDLLLSYLWFQKNKENKRLSTMILTDINIA